MIEPRDAKIIATISKEFDHRPDAEALSQLLPILADKLEAIDKDISQAGLRDHAELGVSHIQRLLNALDVYPAMPQPLTYEAIKLALRPESDTGIADSVCAAKDGADLERVLAGLDKPYYEKDQRKGLLNFLLRANRLDLVKYLHEQGVSIDNPDNLRNAADYGLIETVKYLHQEGADLTKIEGITFMYGVPMEDHLAVIQYLLENGAPLIRNDYEIYTDVDTAYEGEYRPFVIQNSLQSSKMTGALFDRDIFIGAAGEGYLPIVEYLHKSGIDIAASGNYGLNKAAEEGQLEVVRYLHQNGANLTGANKFALARAAEAGHLDVVEYLYQNSAEMRATAHDAAMEALGNGHLDILKYLHQQGADIATNDLAFRLSLHSAIRKGHLPVLQYMHEQGIDILERPNEKVAIAFKSEYQDPHMDIVEYFIQLGVKLDELPNYDVPNEHQAYLTTTDVEILKFALANREAWKEQLQITPPPGMEGLRPDGVTVATMRSVQDWMQQEYYLGDTELDYRAHAYNFSVLFGSEERILRYLKEWGEPGHHPLHDLGKTLSVPQKGSFDAQAWGDAALQYGPEMAALVKFADKLPQPLPSVEATREALAPYIETDTSPNPFDLNAPEWVIDYLKEYETATPEERETVLADSIAYAFHTALDKPGNNPLENLLESRKNKKQDTPAFS